MLFDLKNPKHRKILIMLSISAVAYAVSTVLAYMVAVRMPISITIISIQVGFLSSTILFLYLGREKVSLKPSKANIAVWAYGISFAAIGVMLFIAYKSHSLANIFPLLEGGILVFLALDFWFHRKKLSRKQILILISGVVVVFLGTFFTESIRLNFDLSTLPYAIGMIIFGGIGYYALANNTKKIGEGSKNLAFSFSAIVSAVLFLGFYHSSVVFAALKAVPFIAGVVAGIFLCVAFSMEMGAVRHSMTGSEKKDVLLRNFINNFTELDTVIVLLASVLIGSYTYNGLFGGALIVIGVLVLGSVQ